MWQSHCTVVYVTTLCLCASASCVVVGHIVLAYLVYVAVPLYYQSYVWSHCTTFGACKVPALPSASCMPQLLCGGRSRCASLSCVCGDLFVLPVSCVVTLYYTWCLQGPNSPLIGSIGLHPLFFVWCLQGPSSSFSFLCGSRSHYTDLSRVCGGPFVPPVLCVVTLYHTWCL